jgi:hypothetical protein
MAKIIGLNNHTAVKLTEEKGVGEAVDYLSKSTYLVFFNPSYSPKVFTIDSEEIAFIPDKEMLGKLS